MIIIHANEPSVCVALMPPPYLIIYIRLLALGLLGSFQLFTPYHHLLRRTPTESPCNLAFLFQWCHPTSAKFSRTPWAKGINTWSLTVMSNTFHQVSAEAMLWR